MDHRPRLWSRIAVAIASAVCALCLLGCGPPVPGTHHGNLALDFTLTDADGVAHSLSEYLDFVVWLQFLNVKGANCQLEAEESMPLFYDRFHEDGLVILAVLVGSNEDGDPVGAVDCALWAGRYGLEYPVLWNKSPDDPWKTYNDYSFVPLNVIIDREGVIDHKSRRAEAYTTGGAGYDNRISGLL